MFGKKISLFKLFGFSVNIDLSWIVLAGLVTWSLAAGYFPSRFRGLSSGAYWWMGGAGAVGLFLSIVFHELWHSLVARRFGLPMKGITLFIFGGVSEMTDEPSSAGVEFFMAIAGPVSSIVIGAVFYGFYSLGVSLAWSTPVIAVLGYLAFINWLLAGFNLLPAFPLDGGRVLRSILWYWKKNLRTATRISYKIGSAFGLLMIFYGVFGFITGNVVGGIWFFIIGLFLRNAAQVSYQQVLMRRALEGEKVERFMKKEPVTAPASIPVDRFADEYVYKYHFKMFPVMDDGKLRGCITTGRLKEIPREEWGRHTVGEFASGCSPANTVTPDTDAMNALSRMNSTGNSRLLVVEDGRLAGILTLKDMMRFLSIKMDLGSQDGK